MLLTIMLTLDSNVNIIINVTVNVSPMIRDTFTVTRPIVIPVYLVSTRACACCMREYRLEATVIKVNTIGQPEP